MDMLVVASTTIQSTASELGHLPAEDRGDPVVQVPAALVVPPVQADPEGIAC